MIISRFFKPKWQHPDPQVRKQSIQALDIGDPLLAELASRDQDPAVRCTAIARISEPKLLQQIAEQDPAAGVRELATSRLKDLMAGQAPDSPPLEERLTALAGLASRYKEYLARHGREREIRLAALEAVGSEALLAELASSDPATEIRLAALEKVHDLGVLEQIIKQARNRDKRVSRRARERLEVLQTERSRAERTEYLCKEMESLRWDGENGLNAAKYPKIEKEWQALEPAPDAALQARYNQARARFLEQRQESVARRGARLQLCSELENLLESLQARKVELTGEFAAEIDETLRSAKDRWQQAGAVDSAEERRLEQRFLQLSHALRERERLLQRDRERAERLRVLLGQAAVLLDQPSEVLEADLSALKQRWSSMERPEGRGLAGELQAQFDTLLSRLYGRLQRQEEHRDQELSQLQELLDELEKALEAGELQLAITLQDQARERLKHTIGLSRKQMTLLETRLHGCLPRLDELRGWRRWGASQAREHLCEEAERLVGLPADPEEIAQRIRSLRTHWKILDSREDHAAARALWKRFDQACEQAYEPCRLYFDAQAKERQDNFSKKQALCERLEQFEAQQNWDQPDWLAADRLLRETQNQWHKLGPVPRAQKKPIEQRYSEALNRLGARLQPERERELRRRRALIERLKMLAESDDVRTAVEAAKQAQAEWHPSVQASPREEQALWRKFRTACDAVFDRRKAERQAADFERQANLDQKIALCEEIESLARKDSETIQGASERVQRLKAEWPSLGPVPKEMVKALEQRFEAACREFAWHVRELREARLRKELQELRERALLCSRLEALLAVGRNPVFERTAVEQARQDWESLGHLRSPWVDAVRQRFDQVCRVLLEGADARQALLQALHANLSRKQTLCLRMEILAGVESPVEFAQARMQYQVSRLTESFNGGVVESPDQIPAIKAQWYSLGVLPVEQNEVLEERFQRALNALGEDS